MIFEIVGVDGSGKTTLIHGLRRKINEAGQAFAYERAFQSEGVRLLEAAASKTRRQRPMATFGRPVVEAVRTVELVRRSFELQPYRDSRVQHVFTDSYIIEQLGRMLQFDAASDQLLEVIAFAVPPTRIIYLKVTPELALERMRSRPKGDAMLLAEDPLSEARKTIAGLEAALGHTDPARLSVIDGSLAPDCLMEAAFEFIVQDVNSNGQGKSGA